jgi:hypothetical protein
MYTNLSIDKRDASWLAPGRGIDATWRQVAPGMTHITHIAHTPPPVPGWMKPKAGLGSGRGDWKLDTSLKGGPGDWDTPRNTLRFFLACGLLSGLGVENKELPDWFPTT